ncbi:MAG: glycosyltransferase family 4 protein [Raineya sp.]
MRILYLHQYFRKPEEAGSHRSWYIAHALCQAGHQVHILTATHQNKAYSEELFPNLWVHYISNSYHQAMGFWQRIFTFFSFVWKGLQKTKKIDFEIVYASSTPLSIGLMALFIKKIHKKKYIFEVRDLWPQVPIEMKILKNPLLKNLSYFLERKIYQNAEKIVALSPAMQAHIEQIVLNKEVICVPNMADCRQFRLEERRENRPFRLLYAGSIGLANGLERVLAWAEHCSWAEFWIVGEGAKKQTIMSLVEKKQLSNVYFFSQQNKEALQDFFSQVDAVIISFADYKILETCSPNKFFDALAAGKVCFTNTAGWIKDLIEKHRCGFYAPTPQDFEQQLRCLQQNPATLKTMQKNARKLAENNFERTMLCKKIVELF